MNYFKITYLVIVPLLLLIGCGSKYPYNPNPAATPGNVYVVNEGGFMHGNATVSLYDPVKNIETEDVFKPANNYNLGDVAQSMYIIDSTGYIVVNNSAKIEVVSLRIFKVIRTINIAGSSPRYFQPINDSIAYVTELYANCIWILNFRKGVVLGSINANGWTEQMATVGTTVYVAQRTKLNGAAVRNVLVINSANNQIIGNITLPSEPNSMVKDAHNQLWVLCDSNKTLGVFASLNRINTISNSVAKTYSFSSYSHAPSRININATGTNLYYLDTAVFSMNITDSVLPASSLIAGNNRNLYGLGINPLNGEIYLSDAGNYQVRSTIYRYTQTGSLLTTFQAGIIAGSFTFW